MSTPPINMISCQSSTIASYGYHAATQTLAIQFKNGGLYHYHDVPQPAFAGLADAKSPGQYVHQEIKGKFQHSAVGESDSQRMSQPAEKSP